MFISNDLTQTIVTSMKDIIGYEINYIGIDGMIEASTDPIRIGTKHEGAKKAIKAAAKVAIDADSRFFGAKPGINIPVYFESKIIGVVGITGPIEEVEKYGHIIKKMFEILILDTSQKELLTKFKDNSLLLINDLLLNTKESNSHISFPVVLGFKSHVNRYVIVANYQQNTPRTLDVDLESELFKFIVNQFGYDEQNAYAVDSEKIIMIIHAKHQNGISDLIKDLSTSIYNEFNLDLNWGIGTKATSFPDLKQSFENAKISIACANHKNNIIKYEDLDIGLLLATLKMNIKNEYLNKILKNMTDKDIKELITLINIYEKHNGSVNKCAEELFIHKNTFQYKLNRIYKLTGYNLRSYHDFTLLKLAASLVELDQ